MNAILTLDELHSLPRVFALDGQEMRAHKGRSVVRLIVDGKTCYLKRFWLTASQLFQGHVGRGHHELAMIDWLNANGFAGPKVIAHGSQNLGPLRTRLFFLMEEIPDELPLERTWLTRKGHAPGLIDALASFAARLHDTDFVHTDFSERHIFVSQNDNQWQFRLIDLERASLKQATPQRAAADLKTLAASIADEQLRRRIETDLLDAYLQARRTLAATTDFRALYANAKATKSFY